jgi:uncharacterized membrane protein
MNNIKEQAEPPQNLKEYLLSDRAYWFWTTILLAMATTVTVFTVPENSYLPLVLLRYGMGLVFILFLPGYAFIKALFPTRMPVKTSSENPDNIERIALSIGMSLALVPIVGLLLNYTPWGIRTIPIILSLLTLTVALALAAMLRDYQKKANQSKTED